MTKMHVLKMLGAFERTESESALSYLVIRLNVAAHNAFHSFRHTIANHLKQLGAGEKKISAILGHADRNISTVVYGMLAPTEK
jgi:integrase